MAASGQPALGDRCRGASRSIVRIAGTVCVPGVTSALAAPAYAGIPVTHRGLSTHVTVVVQDLTLEIAHIHLIEIHQPDPAHTGCRQVESGRRSQTTGTDQAHGDQHETEGACHGRTSPESRSP